MELVYLYTYIFHKNQQNVGKYTSPMDPSWENLCVCTFKIIFHRLFEFLIVSETSLKNQSSKIYLKGDSPSVDVHRISPSDSLLRSQTNLLKQRSWKRGQARPVKAFTPSVLLNRLIGRFLPKIMEEKRVPLSANDGKRWKMMENDGKWWTSFANSQAQWMSIVLKWKIWYLCIFCY